MRFSIWFSMKSMFAANDRFSNPWQGSHFPLLWLLFGGVGLKVTPERVQLSRFIEALTMLSRRLLPSNVCSRRFPVMPNSFIQLLNDRAFLSTSSCKRTAPYMEVVNTAMTKICKGHRNVISMATSNGLLSCLTLRAGIRPFDLAHARQDSTYGSWPCDKRLNNGMSCNSRSSSEAQHPSPPLRTCNPTAGAHDPPCLPLEHRLLLT